MICYNTYDSHTRSIRERSFWILYLQIIWGFSEIKSKQIGHSKGYKMLYSILQHLIKIGQESKHPRAFQEPKITTEWN